MKSKYVPRSPEECDVIAQRILEGVHTDLHDILLRIKHPHDKGKLKADLGEILGRAVNALTIL
jgi:hypothetical protein